MVTCGAGGSESSGKTSRGELTWLGTLGNSAIPDLMAEFRSVVVHVDHVDHNINRVLNLVPVQVHCVSSQLEESTNTRGL